MGEPHIYPFTSIRGRYKGRTFLLQWHPTGKRRGRPRGVKNGDKKPLQGRHKAYYTSTYKRKDGTVGRRLKPNPSVLYEITHQVRIKPKLGLRERSTRVVAQSYEEKFKTNLNSALKEKNKNK